MGQESVLLPSLPLNPHNIREPLALKVGDDSVKASGHACVPLMGHEQMEYNEGKDSSHTCGLQ